MFPERSTAQQVATEPGSTACRRDRIQTMRFCGDKLTATLRCGIVNREILSQVVTRGEFKTFGAGIRAVGGAVNREAIFNHL